MKKVFTIFFVIIFVSLSPILLPGSEPGKIDKKKSGLSEKEQEELIKLVLRTHPFKNSPDQKYGKETINQFFTSKIYEKLRGNLFLGYSYDEGLEFSGNRIGLDILKTTEQTQEYKKVFLRSMVKVFNKQTIEITGKTGTNANTERFGLGICIVSVQPVRTKESFPGLVVEMYITDKKEKKSFFRRFYAGKLEGFEAACIDACMQMIFTLKALSTSYVNTSNTSKMSKDKYNE